MTPSNVFSLATYIAMPMWVLLIFLPNWKITRFLIDFKVVPMVLSFIYAIYIFIFLKEGGGLDFASLNSVMDLFTLEQAVLAGWVHYLAFDLLVGMWMINQNKKLGIHPLLMTPCLIATFMLGPIGFLAFMLIKIFKNKQS